MNVACDHWDRTFLDLSSKMAEPFCEVWHLLTYRLIAPLDPKKFENCDTRAKEICFRILIGLGTGLSAFVACAAPLPVFGTVTVLGVGSRIFRAIGFALQKGGYTHVQGAAPEKTLSGRLKATSWNICGIGGGLSLDHGGVTHWRYRLDAIVKAIRTEDPDVLVLQEVYDTALAEALIQKLQAEYAHFYIHLGPSAMGSVGGCMILSKCATYHFSHESFTNNDWTLNRGIGLLEVKARPEDSLPCARILGSHLIHGSKPKDQQNRLVQVAQIVDAVAKRNLKLEEQNPETPKIPTLFLADANIERDGEAGEVFASHFRHSYNGKRPTCTNRLVAQWDGKNEPDEIIDCISIHRETAGNAVLEEAHLVEAFDETYNTRTALSDHQGLSTTLTGF